MACVRQEKSQSAEKRGIQTFSPKALTPRWKMILPCPSYCSCRKRRQICCAIFKKEKSHSFRSDFAEFHLPLSALQALHSANVCFCVKELKHRLDLKIRSLIIIRSKNSRFLLISNYFIKGKTFAKSSSAFISQHNLH